MICTFNSTTAYYASCPSPELPLVIEWDSETGTPTNFAVNTGAAYFLHSPDAGVITQEGNGYNVNIYVTAKGYENENPHIIRGKITMNVTAGLDGAVFAATWEGTGASWIVADGTLTLV